MTSVEPISDASREILANAEHIVLGISPFNAYFTEHHIRELVEWAHHSFGAMHVFVPDEPSAFTLRATGYPEDKANKKARRQANYLLNKIHRALDSIGIASDVHDDMILTWQKLAANPRFLDLWDDAKRIYVTDGEFQTDCRAEALRVLKHHSSGRTISPEALDLAAKYFLCEMPLFLDSASILEHSSSVFAYRECIPLLGKLYLGEYEFSASAGQGFVVVKCSTEDEVTAFQGMFI